MQCGWRMAGEHDVGFMRLTDISLVRPRNFPARMGSIKAPCDKSQTSRLRPCVEYAAEWEPSVRRDHLQVHPGVRLASSIHSSSSGRCASSRVVTLMYRVRSVVPSGGGEAKSAPPRKTTFTETS